ncbi:MAG: hypothetical protein KAJ40_02120 [Alphaproteobacteria bacterium]|nr:hypothetical protein [Alphaproteobacteria bacterium]
MDYIATLLGLNVTNNALSPLYLGEIDILALPPDLQSLEHTQSLEGEIISTNQDGRVIISTQHGNVTINTDQAARLKNGQNIELRIDAGTPPVKAVLRPLNIGENEKTEHTQRSSSVPVQTTLTQDTHEMMESSILLHVKDMLSGIPLIMTHYKSDQPLSQPFMSQIDSVLSFPVNIGNITQNLSFPILETGYTSLSEQNNIAEYDVSPLISAIKLSNVSALPFRNIAAQFVATSEETRISYNPDISNVEQTSLDTSSHKMEAMLHGNYNSISSTHHIQINVYSFSPAQIHFHDKSTETDTVTNANTNKNPGNLHSVYNPHRADNSDKNHNALLPSSILSARIGVAHAQLEGFTETHGFAVLRIFYPENIGSQLYALDTPIEDIPVGSQFAFYMNVIPDPTKIQHNRAAPATTATAISVHAFDPSHFMTPGNWPIMEDIQQSLNQSNTQAAQVFNALLPSASSPAQFGACVLLFISTMRMGNAHSWLGEKIVDTLKRTGKNDLLKRLEQEFSSLSQINKKHISGQWRALSVPLMWQNDIHKLAIYTRNEPQESTENNHDKKGHKTRFIVDTTLSHIGPTQLDGLFTRISDNIHGKTIGHLDLILRTKQSFSQAMKHQMRHAYINALEETRITGALSFQDHLAEWVRITPDKITKYSADI